MRAKEVLVYKPKAVKMKSYCSKVRPRLISVQARRNDNYR